MRRGALPVLRTSLAHFRRISCSVGVMSLRSSFWKPSGPGDLPFLSFEMNPCHSPSVSVPRKRCSCSPTSLSLKTPRSSMKRMQPTAFLFRRKSVNFQHWVQKPCSSLRFASTVATGMLALVLHVLGVGCCRASFSVSMSLVISRLWGSAMLANMGSWRRKGLLGGGAWCSSGWAASCPFGLLGAWAPSAADGTLTAMAGALGWHLLSPHRACGEYPSRSM